jgi:predicted TIM-barrel fold metal-dependent hydrolase
MTVLDLIPPPKLREIPADSWKPPKGIRLISADDHHQEVENLWEDRLPAKWRDQAPKLWQDEVGMWHLEAEGKVLTGRGVDQDISQGAPGYWDMAERQRVMKAEHIEGSVIFHGRLQALNALQDKELYWACIDVYNEWLAEHLRPYPNLVGVPVLPAFLKPAAARDYMQKLKQLGYKAVQMPSYPRGVRYNSREMDPLWAAIAESGIPLSFHVGAYLEFFGYGAVGANIARNLSPFRGLLGQLTFAGVFERHPELKVVFTEGGAAWAASAITDMDQVFRVYYDALKPKLSHPPSFYWKRQCYCSFMVDPVGLELVDVIGADHMLWSTDYPHAEGVVGYAGQIAKSIYEKVGHEKAAKILGGNAAKLWNL